MTEKDSEVKPAYELMEHELRFRIFTLLSIYPELSFSQISKKLGKSKSTLHPHLEKLMEIELIHISRKEKVRGKFERFYYSLKPGYEEKTQSIDREIPDDINEEFEKLVLNDAKTWITSLKNILDAYIQFFETLPSRENYSERIKKYVGEEAKLNETAPFSSISFLTEKDYKTARKLFFNTIIKEMEEFQDKSSGKIAEKPYCIITLGIPIKEVLESTKP